MSYMRLHRSNTGFTLIELMIVVIIIGVIASLAIPRFMASTAKAKTAEAEQILKQIHVQQRAYRQEYDTYWGNGAVADSDNPEAFMKLGVYVISSARYTYTIVADQTSYTCTATANLDDDPTVDTWTIDGGGALVNPVNDVVE